MNEEEDDRILRNVQSGDVAAYSTLVGRFQERIFRLAWRITGDGALAEEATAQVLVKLWTKAGQWRNEARAQTWIYRITVRTTLDVQRSQQAWWRRWANASATAAVLLADPAKLVEQEEECQRISARLQSALMRLAPADRALVHLYYYENRSLAELQVILGVGRDALKMRLARARQRLRELWRTDAEIGIIDEVD